MKYTIINTTLETTHRTEARNRNELIDALTDDLCLRDAEAYANQLADGGTASHSLFRRTISIFAHD